MNRQRIDIRLINNRGIREREELKRVNGREGMGVGVGMGIRIRIGIRSGSGYIGLVGNTSKISHNRDNNERLVLTNN